MSAPFISAPNPGASLSVSLWEAYVESVGGAVVAWLEEMASAPELLAAVARSQAWLASLQSAIQEGGWPTVLNTDASMTAAYARYSLTHLLLRVAGVAHDPSAASAAYKLMVPNDRDAVGDLVRAQFGGGPEWEELDDAAKSIVERVVAERAAEGWDIAGGGGPDSGGAWHEGAAAAATADAVAAAKNLLPSPQELLAGAVATLAVGYVVRTAGEAIMAKRRTKKKSTTRRRRRAAKRIDQTNAAIQAIVAGATGAVAARVAVPYLLPLDTSGPTTGAGKDFTVGAMESGLAALGGAALSIWAGRDLTMGGAVARGVGDALAAVGGMFVALPAESRTAVAAALQLKAEDAKIAAKAKVILGQALTPSTTGRLTAPARPGAATMRRAAAARLGVRNAGLVSGPAALQTGRLSSGAGALQGGDIVPMRRRFRY